MVCMVVWFEKLNFNLQLDSWGMGKRHKLLRVRYFTDITSRWKLGEGVESLESKFAEYRSLANPPDNEYSAFVQSVEDYIFETEANDYQEMLSRKRATFQDIRYYASTVPYPSVETRLLREITQWERKAADELFESRVALYESFLLRSIATVDEIRSIIANHSGRIRRRLFSWIDTWFQTHTPVDMRKIANDKQNIHTMVINKQTNDMLVLLQNVPIPKAQKTMSEIVSAWEIPYEIECDMRLWANKPTIVQENDFLYRNTLRAVWAKIQLYEDETRKELVRRLSEECAESLGMCAQGHISRLVNIFVGFDDQFVSKESFQDKMSAIARSAIDQKAKRDMASALMDEAKMGVEERQSWLEALE